MIHDDLPLIDLHRHLDGNVRLSTILDLGRKHNIALPADTLEGLRPHVQVTEPQTDILAYFQKFSIMVSIFADYDACRRVAYENVLDAFVEGIDYIELRFSPWFMAEPHQLDPVGVVEAVVDGVHAGIAEVEETQVNLLGIISRTYGMDIAHKELMLCWRIRKILSAWTWLGMKPITRRIYSFPIIKKLGMLVGGSLCMLASPLDRRAFGMP
jgi:adenosine deaminase